jgi:hypothetical protein
MKVKTKIFRQWRGSKILCPILDILKLLPLILNYNWFSSLQSYLIKILHVQIESTLYNWWLIDSINNNTPPIAAGCTKTKKNPPWTSPTPPTSAGYANTDLGCPHQTLQEQTEAANSTHQPIQHRSYLNSSYINLLRARWIKDTSGWGIMG